MSVTRQKQLLELALISQEANTNEQVKAALEITDTDLTPVYLEIADLQEDVSDLQSDIISLSGAIDNIETFSELVSSNAEIDINNLDLSFTEIIATQVPLASSPPLTGSSVGDISGADLRINGFINLSIGGVNYKIPTVEEI